MMKFPVAKVFLSLLMVMTPLSSPAQGEGGGGSGGLLGGMTREEYQAWRAERARIAEENRRRQGEATSRNYESQANQNVNQDALNGGGKLDTPSANQAARAGQGSNSSAGQISQMVGQALQSQGGSMMGSCCGRPGGQGCCMSGAMLMALGLLGLQQAAGNRSTAGHHSGISDITTDSGGSPYDNSYSGDGGGSSSPFADAGKDKIKEIEGHGFEFNAKNGTITTPGGKTFNVSDAADKAAMTNAGVSSADFDKAMAMASDFEKKASAEVEKMGAHTAVQGMAGSGGGGGGSSGGSRDLSSASPDGADSYSYKKANDPKPTVAGMMKNYNGEMIGVAGDSIFAMMARRYQQKHKEEAFLPPESMPGANN